MTSHVQIHPSLPATSLQTALTMTVNRSFDFANKRIRWDDWVPQDRLRKLNDENRELANSLKKELEAMRRGSQTQKAAPTSHKKKPEVGSTRGSEGRETPVQSSTSMAGRKRGRDFEVERVGHFTFTSLTPCFLLFRPHHLLFLLSLLSVFACHGRSRLSILPSLVFLFIIVNLFFTSAIFGNTSIIHDHNGSHTRQRQRPGSLCPGDQVSGTG